MSEDYEGSDRSQRYRIVNLGWLGKQGESMFSTVGVSLATDLIEEGWVPCGLYKTDREEIIQAFYLPLTLKL